MTAEYTGEQADQRFYGSGGKHGGGVRDLGDPEWRTHTAQHGRMAAILMAPGGHSMAAEARRTELGKVKSPCDTFS